MATLRAFQRQGGKQGIFSQEDTQKLLRGEWRLGKTKKNLVWERNLFFPPLLMAIKDYGARALIPPLSERINCKYLWKGSSLDIFLLQPSSDPGNKENYRENCLFSVY